MSSLPPNDYEQDHVLDPREWILEDPATFQQLIDEVGEIKPSAPDKDELGFQNEGIKRESSWMSSRTARSKQKLIGGILEDGPEGKGRWMDHYMSGALGVRDAEDCGGLAVDGRERDGDGLSESDGDGMVELSTAGLVLSGSVGGILKGSRDKKDNGKERVRFDVEDESLVEDAGPDGKKSVSGFDHGQYSGKGKARRSQKADGPGSLGEADSRGFCEQYSYLATQEDDVEVSRRTICGFL